MRAPVISTTILNMKLSPEVARYVVRYHWDLMTDREREAQRHLLSTIKATGRSDLEAQEDARKSLNRLEVAMRTVFWVADHAMTPSRFLSNDPSVLRLVVDGYESFELGTAARILQERGAEVRFNLCPRCGKLARTPTAKQCRHCATDWHGA